MGIITGGVSPDTFFLRGARQVKLSQESLPKPGERFSTAKFLKALEACEGQSRNHDVWQSFLECCRSFCGMLDEPKSEIVSQAEAFSELLKLYAKTESFQEGSLPRMLLAWDKCLRSTYKLGEKASVCSLM